MNKVSSKLAAGVRQVKSQQKPAPAPAKPAPADRAGSQAAATKARTDRSALHPERVWPD